MMTLLGVTNNKAILRKIQNKNLAKKQERDDIKSSIIMSHNNENNRFLRITCCSESKEVFLGKFEKKELICAIY